MKKSDEAESEIRRAGVGESTETHTRNDGRSADDHPSIESEGDLERVTSSKKPAVESGLHGLSREAKEQIDRKLNK